MLNNSEFKSFRMQGWLRKRVQEVKFFQRNGYPKRFFIVDFTKAIILIQYKRE